MDRANGFLCLIIIHRFFLDVVLLSTLHHTLADREIERLLSFFAKGVPSSLHGSDADARSDGGLKSLKINNYEMWKQRVKVGRLP